MKRHIIFLAIGALAIAGCGSSSDKTTSSTGAATTSTASGGATAGGGAGSKLALSADPSQLKFDKSTLSAKAGKVTITMANPSSLSHNVSIEGNGVDKDGNTVGNGGTSTVSADLKPGSYTFYCSVDGHEAGGMKGTLTVK